MNDSYSTTIAVDRVASEVFDAVTDIRRWWMADVDGSTESVGDEFSYQVPGMHYCKMRVIALDRPTSIVWKVIESDMTFVEDTAEWVGTEMHFTVTPTSDGAELVFTHEGLVPDFECYDACSTAWSHYVGSSLRNYLTTGTGDPGTSPGEQRQRTTSARGKAPS